MATRPCLGLPDERCREDGGRAALVRGGPRCSVHAAAFDAPAREVYDDPRWRALTRRTIREWIAEHGPWCPGDDRHEAHVSFDLTLDHVAKFSAGGARFDRANTRVLCRQSNSAGARRAS